MKTNVVLIKNLTRYRKWVSPCIKMNSFQSPFTQNMLVQIYQDWINFEHLSLEEQARSFHVARQVQQQDIWFRNVPLWDLVMQHMMRPYDTQVNASLQYRMLNKELLIPPDADFRIFGSQYRVLSKMLEFFDENVENIVDHMCLCMRDEEFNYHCIGKLVRILKTYTKNIIDCQTFEVLLRLHFMYYG